MTSLNSRELTLGLLSSVWLLWLRAFVLIALINAAWIGYLAIERFYLLPLFSSLALSMEKSSIVFLKWFCLLASDRYNWWNSGATAALVEMLLWPFAGWIALALVLRLPNHRLQQCIDAVLFMLFYILSIMLFTLSICGFFKNPLTYGFAQMPIIILTLLLVKLSLQRIEQFVSDYWLDASGERDERDNQKRNAMHRYWRI